MVALQCCMSAILTKSKIKDNCFRNFSQSALFPEIKLAAELTNMLKFPNIIKYVCGETILWPRELNTYEANLTKLHDWPF